jgi:hypothetical protein
LLFNENRNSIRISKGAKDRILTFSCALVSWRNAISISTGVFIPEKKVDRKFYLDLKSSTISFERWPEWRDAYETPRVAWLCWELVEGGDVR